MSDRSAPTQYPIHPLLEARWSPRAFAARRVTTDQLQRLFEAARWSPSASNEQPWRFILGCKGDESYQKIFDTLVEFNQIWAQTAPVLIMSCGRRQKGDTPLPYAPYDVGQAVAHLSFQAQHEGLLVHQMAGFDTQMAREKFNIPEAYEALTVIAVGYLGDPEQLPKRMAQGESRLRERQALNQMVVSHDFEQASSLFK